MYLNRNFRIVSVALFLMVLMSCAQNKIYKRHTDLHHVKTPVLHVIGQSKDSIRVIIDFYNYETDTINSRRYNYIKSDTSFRFLESKRVIYIHESYYIRKGVKNKFIREKYYNRDVKF